MQRLFITGTDTDVGKTWVACAILRALRDGGIDAAAYKPVCSGARLQEGRPEWSDIEQLYAACAGRWPRETICPQRFLAPLAPTRAAEAEGRRVDFAQAVRGAAAFPDAEFLIVEGAGGLYCPLTEQTTMADLSAELATPLVIVAANRLGTVNHTLLTCAAARSRHLPIAAIVLSDVSPQLDASAATNRPDIERHLEHLQLTDEQGAPPVLTLGWRQTGIESRDGALRGIDWRKLASGARLSCIRRTPDLRTAADYSRQHRSI